MFRSGPLQGNKSSESPPSTIADTTMEALFSSQASYYITSCYSTSIALPPHAEDDCNAEWPRDIACKNYLSFCIGSVLALNADEL